MSPEPTRILIIDDDAAARHGIVHALQSQEGYLTAEAQDGKAALESVEAWQPDVVVADINLPGIDGRSLLSHLSARADPPLLILVTAYGSETAAIEALRHGAYDYLSKPINVDELRAAVRNAAGQRRLQREIQRYQRQLEATLSELRQSQAALVRTGKIAALGRLVAGVAHEVNTPLGVLQSSTDTVARAAQRMLEHCARQPGGAASPLHAVAEVLGETVRQAQVACHRIEAVVTSLRQFAQLDRADVQLVSVHSCVDSALALMRSELDGIAEVHRDFADDVPPIACSPRDMNEAFLNLLLNARDAIREKGQGVGRIDIRTRLDQSAGQRRVRVDVEDSGCGISPAHLERIFEPGFTTKGVGVGMGLGLPICFQTVQAHGGTMEVRSEPGQGTTVILWLPVRDLT